MLTGSALVAAGASATFLAGAPAASARRARPGRDGPLEVVLLGTAGGPPPSPDRYGISSALRVEDKVYVIDCGRGSVSQYQHAGLGFDKLTAMFITHLHIDHVTDYYSYFELAGLLPGAEWIGQRVDVFGPGPAGGLPPTYGGGSSPTVNPADPTPGLADLTERAMAAYAYSRNVFMRDSGAKDPRDLLHVTDIAIPDVGASYVPGHTAPVMQPFPVMEDDRVRVSAILVPHGPVFPAFAYRFDTDYGSVVFSGDTRTTPNIPTLAHDADLLVHECINLAAYQKMGLPEALLDHLQESHTLLSEVGPIAEQAGVRMLVLSHLGPNDPVNSPDHVWRKGARTGFSGWADVGSDLMRIPVRNRHHRRR
jgi:ribonuclease BN (tRNA processing enzyme)